MSDEQSGSRKPSTFGSAYDSIYGDPHPKVAASPSRMSWTLPVIVAVLVALVAALTFALTTRPKGWLDLKEIKVTSDEGYLYLMIRTSGAGDPDWNHTGIAIAIDTYDAELGEVIIPEPINTRVGSGVEFLITLLGPGQSEIKVTRTYQPYVLGNPVFSPERPSGEFVTLPFYPNAERYSRSGEYFPPVIIDRGILRYGSLDPESPFFHTLTDVAVGDGVAELRIPWNLLNVTDPSTKRVIHSEEQRNRLPGVEEEIGTLMTRGFRIYAVSFDPSSKNPGAVDQLPPSGDLAPLYQWPTWDTPRFKLEPKYGIDRLRETMKMIPDHPEGGPS